MSIEFIKDQFIWAEKYRPSKLSDVIVPSSVKEKLLGYIQQGEIPNFLFYSPSPGTGKTTVAKALCNELGIRPLFINCSAQNSIDDVRTLIRDYATTVSLGGTNIKVVIADEAERLSRQAQDALKALIEEVSKNCRFIFTSNSKSKIIEPLRSRCVEVDFVFDGSEANIVSAYMFERCSKILDHEKVEYNEKVLALIVQKYSPDNRKILQVLQDYASANNTIDEGILAQLQTSDISTLVDHLKEKDFKSVLQWCFDAKDGAADDFYIQLYDAMKTRINAQSIPELILILGNEQKHHDVVPDMYLHLAQICTQVMMQVQFK